MAYDEVVIDSTITSLLQKISDLLIFKVTCI
jgi:hypothetical protein